MVAIIARACISNNMHKLNNIGEQKNDKTLVIIIRVANVRGTSAWMKRFTIFNQLKRLDQCKRDLKWKIPQRCKVPPYYGW